VVGDRAVALQEAQQVGHLLQVGGHVRVVTREVRVVELDVDDVLDRALRRLQLAPGGGRAGSSLAGGQSSRDAEGEQSQQSSNASCVHASPLSLNRSKRR